MATGDPEKQSLPHDGSARSNDDIISKLRDLQEACKIDGYGCYEDGFAEAIAEIERLRAEQRMGDKVEISSNAPDWYRELSERVVALDDVGLKNALMLVASVMLVKNNAALLKLECAGDDTVVVIARGSAGPALSTGYAGIRAAVVAQANGGGQWN
jgi:hypothetical protein